MNAPVSIAFVLKRFAAKAPCVKIKGDFILLLELLIGHRGADGCEPRHLALILLANSDYLIPTEKGLLSILQLQQFFHNQMYLNTEDGFLVRIKKLGDKS